MNENIYEKLAAHLDSMSEGFPPSTTGAHLRLLEKLFTPAEAELAVGLTLNYETAGQIAERAGLSVEEITQRLEEMVSKGLVLSTRADDGGWLYQALPYLVGIYEMQVNNLNRDLLRALYDYWRTMEERVEPQTLPQMRTIPIHESIDARLEALPYEQVFGLVETQNYFAVAPCICRRMTKIQRRGCDAPEEACLSFGDWAEYYVRIGRAREITRAEVLDILVQADKHNLVLQPSNSVDISFICCCCGCCCGVLNELKLHPRPADAVASSFIASYDPDLCIDCRVCVERCQMGALVVEDDRLVFKAERCIGCGLCVSTCPSGALKLERKPEAAIKQVPQTMHDTWRIMTEQRKQAE